MTVHGTHCCKHHCKYAEDNCPVVSGQEPGIVDENCEECDGSKYKIAETDFLFYIMNEGFRLYWSDSLGEFGQIDFVVDKQINKWSVKTEYMGKDFVMKVFEHFLNSCELVE